MPLAVKRGVAAGVRTYVERGVGQGVLGEVPGRDHRRGLRYQWANQFVGVRRWAELAGLRYPW